MRLNLPRLLCALALSPALLASAKIEEWKDPQGAAFKAEPAEIFGPLALFKTPTGTGRRLPWRALSAADCVRFDEQVSNKAAPAARWIDAKGILTGRLRGFVGKFEGTNLVTADLTARPEPLVLIVFVADSAASGAWEMLKQSSAPFLALQNLYPGRIDGIQIGINHSPKEHSEMALRSNIPWLLADHHEQREIPSLFRLATKRGDFAMLALSRDGVPIFAANNPNEAAIKQFFIDVNSLLDLSRPGNPAGWPDRAHHLSAVHAAQHKQDSAGPLLVGDPLVPSKLKPAGIFRVAATIAVGADGKATAVTIKSDGSLSKEVESQLAGPLKRATVFAPAVDHGQPVAGTYEYLLEIPH